MGWFGDAMDFTGKALKWGAPLALAPLTGGASLAAYSVYGANSANKANKDLSREQMAFQERMSSTEVQRRVADLRAAGLNPMLAAMDGASSPSGSMARMENPAKDVVSDVSSASGAAVQRKQLEQMDAQTRLINEQAATTRAQRLETIPSGAQASAAQVQKAEADIQLLAQEFKNAQARYDISMEDLRQRRLTNDQFEKLAPLLETAQRLQNILEAAKVPGAENMKQFEESFVGDAAPWMKYLREVFGPRRLD